MSAEGASEQRLRQFGIVEGDAQAVGAVQIVSRLLEATSQSTPPTDLAAITSLWPGLTVTVDDLDGAGYLLDYGPAGGEIVLRREDGVVRRRFTWAHELGHWLLAEHCFDPDRLLAGQPNDDQKPAGRVERWCDGLAAELMMPSAWVAPARSGSARDCLAFAAEIPERFEVSYAAAVSRVAEVSGRLMLDVRSSSGQLEIREYAGTPVPPSAVGWLRKHGLPRRAGQVHAVHLSPGNMYLLREPGSQSGFALVDLTSDDPVVADA